MNIDKSIEFNFSEVHGVMNRRHGVINCWVAGKVYMQAFIHFAHI